MKSQRDDLIVLAAGFDAASSSHAAGNVNGQRRANLWQQAPMGHEPIWRPAATR